MGRSVIVGVLTVKTMGRRVAVVSLLTLIGVAAGSCAKSLPPEVLNDMPTAIVTFSKGYLEKDQIGVPANTVFEYYADADCVDLASVPLSRLTANSRTELVPATRKLFFAGTATIVFTEHGARYCLGFAGFKPRAGATYSMTLKTNTKGCVLEVRDLKTEQPPPDIEFFDAMTDCPPFMRRKERSLPPVEKREPRPTPTQS